MENKKVKNRYIVLVCLFLNMICIGGSYAWSVFANPLATDMNWELSQVTVAYTLLLVCLAFIGIIGGKVLDKIGPRKLLTIAGIAWAAGWFLAGCATQLWQLYASFGLMVGVAGGFFYNPALTTAVRWFPDKRGLASGMIVGAAGLAPLLLAPIANALLQHFGVHSAFKWLGVAFFIVFVLTTWFITNPPEGWLPEGYKPPAPLDTSADEKLADPYEKNWKQMMKDKTFWFMYIAFFGGAMAGITIIGHTSGIGADTANMTATQGAFMVGLMAVANFLGRTLMGALSDKIGRFQTLILCLALNIVALLYFTTVHTFVGFVVALIVVGMCFGGQLAVYPSLTSEAFGLKNMGVNYGVMFTAYGVSAIIGPTVAANLKQNTGAYTTAFIVCAVFAAVALVITIFVFRSIKNRNK